MKHLLGEAGTEEQAEVNRWLEADPANMAYYRQLEKIWLASRELAEVSTVDENKAWKKFQQRIHTNGTTETTTPPSPAPVRGIRQWMKIAAAIVLLVGLGWIGINLFSGDKTTQQLVAAIDKIVVDTLPDGSVVTINKQSEISYPSAFKGKSRSVSLKGEAFFDVTPNKSKPFVITVDDVEIKVVGTSFNIKNHDGITEVIVETGIVLVTRNGATTELRAGEKITLDVKRSIAKEPVGEQLNNYYRPRYFNCDNTPLWKLMEAMNQAYDTTVVIVNPELNDLRLTAPYNNQPVEGIIKNIIEQNIHTQLITYEIKGDSILLK